MNMPQLQRQQRGVGLMEILITLLVLTIGLLGAAQLQLLSLNDAHAADSRVKATLLAYELADRMRANTELLDLLETSNDPNPYLDIAVVDGGQGSAPDAPACANGCNETEQANRDVREWLEQITDIEGVGDDGDAYRPVLDNATAALVETQPRRFQLSLSWQENDRSLAETVTLSYVQEIEL